MLASYSQKGTAARESYCRGSARGTASRSPPGMPAHSTLSTPRKARVPTTPPVRTKSPLRMAGILFSHRRRPSRSRGHRRRQPVTTSVLTMRQRQGGGGGPEGLGRTDNGWLDLGRCMRDARGGSLLGHCRSASRNAGIAVRRREVWYKKGPRARADGSRLPQGTRERTTEWAGAHI